MKFIIGFFVRIYIYATLFLIFINFAVLLTLGKVVLYSDLLFESVFQGFILGGLIVVFHVFRLKKAGVKYFSGETFRLRQKMILITSLSISEIRDKIRKETMSGKIRATYNENEITLEFISIIWGWGFENKIKVSPEENGSNQVEITSRPDMITILFDFGQSLLNVLYIKNLLKVIEQE